jgi:hypothetical protein
VVLDAEYAKGEADAYGREHVWTTAWAVDEDAVGTSLSASLALGQGLGGVDASEGAAARPPTAG